MEKAAQKAAEQMAERKQSLEDISNPKRPVPKLDVDKKRWDREEFESFKKALAKFDKALEELESAANDKQIEKSAAALRSSIDGILDYVRAFQLEKFDFKEPAPPPTSGRDLSAFIAKSAYDVRLHLVKLPVIRNGPTIDVAYWDYIHRIESRLLFVRWLTGFTRRG